MLHMIDYTDHYAQGTSSSLFHFLTLPDDAWARQNAGILDMNRLRPAEMRALFAAAGFAVVDEQPKTRPADPAILANLAPRFRGLPEAELFTEHELLVVRAAG